RVLATTNRNLPAEVAAGRFRADLFYRLNVVPLAVPALRERLDDLPELITHFLAQTAQRLQKEPCTLRRDAQELLMAYHWPGNVRELENIVTRASVLATGPAIAAEDLRPWLIQTGPTTTGGTEAVESVGLRLEDMERKMIEATLDRYGGHRAKTAEALGIGLRTLSGKLKGYGYAPRAKSMAKAA
ncbi:MAG TPA: helix-turn-helix domain-containing protein, partial [Pirellulales bacterium]|nr:helix-turn-helix domain-containing protein [Pirellulales bacterium]